MKEDKKKKSIFVYFLEMLIVFLIIDLFMTVIAGGVAKSSLLSKYGNDLIIEVFYALVIMIVMLLFKNSYVFTEKKEKFWDGVLLAVPMLIISISSFVTSILSVGFFKISSFINMIVFCIFVGIAEEFLCRGWLQNEFIERFSKNKREVITSIILSSLVFGFMHLVNLSSQNLFETILQIINATALGFLLGSVYYKTKNIWSVIFLHSFYDFSIMLGDIDLIKDCTYNTPTLAVTMYESFGIVLISVLWILGAIYVLNKCDFGPKPVKHNNTSLYISMGLVFMLFFLPLDNLIPGYDNYRVCYNYKGTLALNDYIIHYPSKSKYIIEYTKNEFVSVNDMVSNDYRFIVEKNNYGKLVVKNKNTLYQKVFDYSNIIKYEVFESNTSFVIAFLTNENESTLYVSNSIRKDSINDWNSFIDQIKFKSYILPEISKLGYIEDEEDSYVYLLSSNNDEFIVRDGELFLIK